MNYLDYLLSCRKIFLILSFTCLSSCGIGDYDPAAQFKNALAVIHPPEFSDRFTANEENSYIVMFRTASGSNRQNFSNYYNEYKFHFSLVSEKHMSDPRILEMHFLSAVDLAKPEKPTPSDDLKMPRALKLRWARKDLDPIVGAMTQVDFRSRTEAIQVLEEWEKDGVIWYAEPNWISTLSQDPVNPGTTQASNVFQQLATNYAANSNWHWVADMKAVKGYKLLSDQIVSGQRTETDLLANAPVIAVMDSGVDFSNVFLTGRMWENSNIGDANCPGDQHGCDTTIKSRGKLGDGAGVYPFATEGGGMPCPPETENDPISKSRKSNCHHGTHVAGIIAGRSSASDSEAQGSGVPGICPMCKIMVLKVVGSSKSAKGGGIQDSSILNALRYVTRFIRDGTNVVRVVNASLGKFQRSRSVALLVAQLRENGSGTLVIGAAGNEDTNTREYPAALSQALAVSSVESGGKKAGYSNYGAWVDIAAPGGSKGSEILSANPGVAQLHPSVGTSMAAPMVAGVAGIIIAAQPNITASGLKSILIHSADPVIYDEDTNATYYYQKVSDARIPLLGSGRVDLFNALSGGGGGLAIEDFLNDRVASGCGIVSYGSSEKSGDSNNVLSLLLTLIFLFTPVFMISFRSFDTGRGLKP